MAPERNIASNKIHHIVFDIDWTLVSPVEDPERASNVIQVFGEKYRLHDYARELLLKLHKSGKYHISFFSGGESSRNLELLQKIKIDENLSAADIAYKILSKEDLTEVEGVGDHARFSERYKKDISKIDKNISNIIMIDDNQFFALNKEQSKRFLYLGETFKYFETFEYAETSKNKFKGPPDEIKYFPKSYREWELNKKRLGLISEFLEKNFEAVLTDWQSTGIPEHKVQWSKVQPLVPEQNDCLQSIKLVLMR